MKTVKLLIVEDNPLVRELVRKGMDPHCEVATADDGAEIGRASCRERV